jgi:hypothetical protein
MCHSCGKYGHKSIDCCNKDGAKKDDGKNNNSGEQKCYGCNKVGHTMAWECPEKEKEKETGLVVFMSVQTPEMISCGSAGARS